MAAPPGSWREAGERFLESRRGKGRADNTLSIYERVISQFVAFSVGLQFGSVGVDDVDRFLSYVRDRSPRRGRVRGSTMNKARRHVCAWLTWLWRRGWLSTNVAPAVERYTEEKRVKRVPTPEALAKLADVIRGSSSILPPDETQILADLKGVIDNTGFRYREAQYLRVSDCDMVSGLLYLTSWDARPLKTHQERRVAITDACREILARRIMAVGRVPEARLFPPFSKSHKRVLAALKQAAATLGVGNLSFQMLRSAFATWNVQAGVFDPMQLLLQMGWSDFQVARKHYLDAMSMKLPKPINVPAGTHAQA